MKFKWLHTVLNFSHFSDVMLTFPPLLWFLVLLVSFCFKVLQQAASFCGPLTEGI